MLQYSVQDLPKNIPKNLSAFTFEDDMLKITKHFREKFGFNYFAHVIQFPDGKTAGLVTSRNAALHWMINKWSMPGNDHKGGCFPSGYYFVPSMGNLFPKLYRQSLSTLFNIDHMFAIIDSKHSYSEIFVFGTEPDNIQIINFYLNNLNVIKNFVASYKKNAKNIIKIAMEDGVIFPPAKKIIKNSQWTENFLNDPQKNIQLNDKTWLTAREVECLTLISKGKTAKEIGRIINISPRTVEYHLNTSKDKLDCNFKSELIEKFSNIVDHII